MRKLTSTEAQDLCEILEARSHAKSTVITTQLPLDHWEEVIEDTVIADAVVEVVSPAGYRVTVESLAHAVDFLRMLA